MIAVSALHRNALQATFVPNSCYSAFLSVTVWPPFISMFCCMSSSKEFSRLLYCVRSLLRFFHRCILLFLGRGERVLHVHPGPSSTSLFCANSSTSSTSTTMSITLS